MSTDNRQIFVFTAGDAAAQSHLAKSIGGTLPTSLLSEELGSAAGLLIAKLPDPSGFKAWGAVPGKAPGLKNKRNWEYMKPGDFVLAVSRSKYRFVSTIIDKVHSAGLARKIWGSLPTGGTWEYIYLLSDPIPVDVDVLSPVPAKALRRGYQGFSKISNEKVQALSDEYGSIAAFIDHVFGTAFEAVDLAREIAEAEAAAESAGAAPSVPFDALDDTDRRRRVIAEIVRRRGQPKFRRSLIEAYGGRCAISSCAYEAVLEAAHIVPYRGDDTHHITNGLLLRADIHTLFDLGLMSIDHATGAVLISKTLSGTEYERFNGTLALKPADPLQQPSIDALKAHRKTTEL